MNKAAIEQQFYEPIDNKMLSERKGFRCALELSGKDSKTSRFYLRIK
jgi:hypothetical protein